VIRFVDSLDGRSSSGECPPPVSERKRVAMERLTKLEVQTVVGQQDHRRVGWDGKVLALASRKFAFSPVGITCIRFQHFIQKRRCSPGRWL
jgi:hypothetical protein